MGGMRRATVYPLQVTPARGVLQRATTAPRTGGASDSARGKIVSSRGHGISPARGTRHALGHSFPWRGATCSKAGWLLFVAIAFATIAAAERLRWLRAEPKDAVEGAGLPPDAAAYVAPLLAALATALVTSLWAEPGVDRWYVARVLAAGAVLLVVRRSLPAPALSFSGAPLLLGAAVAAAWVLWGSTPRPALAEALAQLGSTERALWIAVRLGQSILVVPVIEELAFRGFLLPWLASPRPDADGRGGWPWLAILLSSLAFGAIHERFLLGVAAGVAFAAARLWRGRLGDAIVAHAVANAGVAAAALFLRKFGLWG